MTIRTIAQTGSTNADVAALARTGLAEGVWLRAERQSAGRGRLNRDWTSPAGNFHGSTLVRLRPSDPAPATLALVAAVATNEAVAAYLPGRAVRLKWPNDLMLDGAKLAGILLERAEDAVVVGIGVNLAHHPDLPDRATTSLAAHAVITPPEAFAETLAEAFARWLGRWRGEGLGVVRAAWIASAHPVGTALRVNLPHGTATDGLFAGLDGDGALMLRLADGAVQLVHAGDVFLLED